MTSPSAIGGLRQETMNSQPNSIRDLDVDERGALIISMRKVDARWIVVSRFADDVWWLTGAPTNVSKSMTRLDFSTIPTPFREVLKEMMYRHKMRGRAGRKRPGASNLIKVMADVRLFLFYVSKLGIQRLSDISPLVCTTYVQTCRELTSGINKHGKSSSFKGTHLAAASLQLRFSAVELIYELSQYSSDPIPHHPWLESSAHFLSKYGRSRRENGNTTPLMNDEVFTKLFQKAWATVQDAERVMDLRDEMDAISASRSDCTKGHISSLKLQALRGLGWEGGYLSLSASLLNIRTCCYIVIASLSGCRNHELSYLKSNAYHSTEDAQGERYWWMRSTSTKTDEGVTEWMIPEAAVKALKVMDRWAAPFQEQLRQQIDAYRLCDPTDVRIAEAQEHIDAIFVGVDRVQDKQVRTLSLTHMNTLLRDFARESHLNWKLSSHQFRRKFANYAARSRFGDLRYLKEHFKHWTLDMTLGYALNDSQEMALYMEIESEYEDLKQKVVEGWLDKAEPLAGGYGGDIANWRSKEENITLFKGHAQMIRSIASSTAIRSNGHAWCTADDNLCDGNDVNPTRCGDGCSSSVIGRRHASIYSGLYNELKVLEDCEDIGEGGLARVQRDIARCRVVLTSLGHDPLESGS